MTRKTFLGGFGAALGSAVLPATAFAKAGEPIMRFGVASDVHIAVGWKEGGDPERLGLRSQPYFLEKALRWFDANKADAVVFSTWRTRGAWRSLRSLSRSGTRCSPV